jgi:hypothetical protein
LDPADVISLEDDGLNGAVEESGVLILPPVQVVDDLSVPGTLPSQIDFNVVEQESQFPDDMDVEGRDFGVKRIWLIGSTLLLLFLSVTSNIYLLSRKSSLEEENLKLKDEIVTLQRPLHESFCTNAQQQEDFSIIDNCWVTAKLGDCAVHAAKELYKDSVDLIEWTASFFDGENKPQSQRSPHTHGLKEAATLLTSGAIYASITTWLSSFDEEDE